MSKKGISIAFAVFTLLVLSVLGAAIFSMLSTDVTTAGDMAGAMKTFYAAEASKEIGAMAVRDDKIQTAYGGGIFPRIFNLTDPTANGYCGISFLEGGYDGCWDFADVVDGGPLHAAFHGGFVTLSDGGPGNTHWFIDPDPWSATMDAVPGAYVALWNFQQRYNLIENVLLRVRMVARVQAGEPNGQLLMQYTTNGGVMWAPDPTGDLEGFLIDVPTVWPYGAENYHYSPALPIGWGDIMSQNFRIRLLRLDASPNPIDIDWLALEVVTEVDASTEPWYSGSYFPGPGPVFLGDCRVEPPIIADEAGKININNAPMYTMWNLFTLLGMPSGDAYTLASQINAYRATKKFETVEELKSGVGVSDGVFDLIGGALTVYSFVNKDAQYTGAVSPVNINTAHQVTLRAIFKNAVDDDGRATELANAIVAQRNTQPFTSTFSSYESTQSDAINRDHQCFAGFVADLDLTFPWITADYIRRIMDCVDASQYNIMPDQNWATDSSQYNALPLCYASHTFKIEGEGVLDRSGMVREALIKRTVTTYGHLYQYAGFNWNLYGWQGEGTFYLPSDPPLFIPPIPRDWHGYWRERK